MLTCAETTALLLDYLYGLLDGDDAQRLQSHLAGCPACQAQLEQAKAQQNLFARAALKYREVPAYQAPPEEPVPLPLFSHFPPAATQVPAGLTAPARPRGRWRRWAVIGAAASVLIAVGTLYTFYHEGKKDREKALADARKEIETIDVRLQTLARELEADRKAVPAQVRGQFLHVELLGPASHQPGAPTPFRLATQTPDGQPTAAHLTVRVRGRAAAP